MQPVIAAMIEDGAAILDVGGESSRPGADSVDADEETLRVVPVIEAIRARWDVPLSVDTVKPEVARQAVDALAAAVIDVDLVADGQADHIARREYLGIGLARLGHA